MDGKEKRVQCLFFDKRVLPNLYPDLDGMDGLDDLDGFLEGGQKQKSEVDGIHTPPENPVHPVQRVQRVQDSVKSKPTTPKVDKKVIE